MNGWQQTAPVAQRTLSIAFSQKDKREGVAGAAGGSNSVSGHARQARHMHGIACYCLVSSPLFVEMRERRRITNVHDV